MLIQEGYQRNQRKNQKILTCGNSKPPTVTHTHTVTHAHRVSTSVSPPQLLVAGMFAHILIIQQVSQASHTMPMNTRKRGQTSTQGNDPARQPKILEPCPLGCVNQNGKPSTHGASRCPQRKRQLEVDTVTEGTGTATETEPEVTQAIPDSLVISALTTGRSAISPVAMPVPDPLTRPEITSEQIVLDNLDDNMSQSSERSRPQSDHEDTPEETNENEDANKANQPAVSNNTVAAAASAPSDALIRRLDQVNRANKEEKRRNKTFEFDDEKRLQKFSKGRKKLKEALHDLGAQTGAFGYLYLSK